MRSGLGGSMLADHKKERKRLESLSRETSKSVREQDWSMVYHYNSLSLEQRILTPSDEELTEFLTSNVALRANARQREQGEPLSPNSLKYEQHIWDTQWQEWMAPFTQSQPKIVQESKEDASKSTITVPCPASDGKEEEGRDLVLQLASNSPSIWTCNEFLSEDECNALVKIGRTKTAMPEKWSSVELRDDSRSVATYTLNPLQQDEDAILKRVQNRLRACTGAGNLNQDQKPMEALVVFNAPEPKSRNAVGGGRCSTGFRLETNMLVYLNDVPKGGETVFPCATPVNGASALAKAQIGIAMKCGQSLARMGCAHTPEAFDFNVKGKELCIEPNKKSNPAALLCSLSNQGFGLRIRPHKGMAVFFSMPKNEAGTAEVPAVKVWRGDAAVLDPNVGKWTLECKLPNRPGVDC